VNSLITEIQTKSLDHPDVLRMLKERGISNVYIGEQQGRVNNPNPILDPDKILTSPYYQPIYHEDRVWIFKILFP
jgi:hypothetical protein